MDSQRLMNYPISMMLPCGCVPGFFYCPEAAELGATLKATRRANLQGEATQEDVAKAHREYSLHFHHQQKVKDGQA